jgi:hypothetical protein
MSDEGLLHGVQLLAAGDPFDRRHRRTRDLKRRNEAAVHQLTVDQHRAGATLPLTAAFLGAGQVQLLAHEVEETRHGVHVDLDRLAVDGEGDVACHDS